MEKEKSPVRRVMVYKVRVEFAINGVILFTEDPKLSQIKKKLSKYRKYVSGSTLKAIFSRLDDFIYSIKFNEDPMILEVVEEGTISMMYCTKVIDEDV